MFILRYNQVGGIRIKQSRVKNHSCEALNYGTGKIDTSADCYAEYSSTANSIDSFGPYLNSSYTCSGLECSYMQAFKYSPSPPDSSSLTGFVSTYDSSGFYIDSESILCNDTLTQAALANLGNYLQDYLWIDKQTRAVLLIFSFYNINFNYFSSMEFLLETSNTGFVYTTVKLNTLYVDYYYDSWNNMKNSAYDFFQKVPEIYCYIYCIFGILFPIIGHLKRDPIGYLKVMWSYIDITLMLIMIGIIVLRVLLYFECESIITSISRQSFNKATDLSLVNYYMSISWGFEAYAALMACLRFLNYFKIQSMTIIWDTLARGSKSIFAFFLVFIVLMCSFTQMVRIVYGCNIFAFINFGSSISSLFMTLLGALNYYPSMSLVSPYFTPIFYTIFMFLMFFVILNIFVAILNESFGVIIALEDKESEKEILGKLKNRLIIELKFISDRVKYRCKKCCKRRGIERSVAFKAFNK